MIIMKRGNFFVIYCFLVSKFINYILKVIFDWSHKVQVNISLKITSTKYVKKITFCSFIDQK